MSDYALVQDNTIVQVGKPDVWNDGTRDWDLRYMSDPDLAALGWLPIIETPRPPDTETTTFDYSIELVDDDPTEVWTERPMTTEEQQTKNEADNKQTLTEEIEQNIATLEQTIANLNAITDVPNNTINQNPASYIKDVTREVKTVARQTIRIAKIIVGDLESAEIPE